MSGLPSAEPVPVLQALLVLGESRQVLRAAWSSPTHVPYAPDAYPIDAPVVDLWLISPGGDSVKYAPTEVAGEFAAIASVSPQETYLLSGSIAARPVAASASLPGNLTVALPAGDTLRLQRTAGSSQLAYAWQSDSAASYQALLLDRNGRRDPTAYVLTRDSLGIFRDIAPDTAGAIMIVPPFPIPSDTARLVIFAYDRRATAFFSSSTRGNVHGAFGLFGGAAKAEKVVVWE